MKADGRRSVLAFRNEKAGWCPKVRRETMTVGARTFALISWCGGEWEVYRIEADRFTETFLGYARDVIGRIARPLSKSACTTRGPLSQ